MSLSEFFQMVAIVEKIATNLEKTSKTILSISTMRCESKIEIKDKKNNKLFERRTNSSSASKANIM
jgi:hypothetical protein